MKRYMGRWLGAIVLATLAGSQVAIAAPVGVDRARLSRGGEGWEASADIDAQGNAVALWVQRSGTDTVHDRIWTKSHRPGQPWSVHDGLSHPLHTTQNTPQIRVSAAGEALAIWNDADGVWAAERTAQGAWGKGRLLIAGAASPLFAMNAQADAVLAWGSGIGPGGPTQLNVMRRDAAGRWQAPQVVARGPSLEFNQVAIADHTGEVVATWETYEAYCDQHCTRVNYVLHALRAARGSPTWTDSGPLSGPLLWSHRAQVAVDPAGRAGIAFAVDFQGVMSMTQVGAGSAWCMPALVYSSTFAYVVGLGSDARGNTTLAFLDEGGTGQLVAMVGSLATGLWNRPWGVSRTDMSVGQAKLASSASGAAVLT